MAFDKELVAAKLRRWEKYLREYRLPEWDRLPDLGLYMEQVTVLMRQYLDYLPPELKEEQFITASTINNYVRMKIMPEPRRRHSCNVIGKFETCATYVGKSFAARPAVSRRSSER